MQFHIISKYGPALYTDEHSTPFVLAEACVLDAMNETHHVQVLRTLAPGWWFQFRVGKGSLLQTCGDPAKHPTRAMYRYLEEARESVFFPVFQKLLPGVVKMHLQFIRHGDYASKQPCRWVFFSVSDEREKLEDIHAECLCPNGAGKGKPLFLQMCVREDGKVVFSASKQSRAFDLAISPAFEDMFPGMKRIPVLSESTDFSALDISDSAKLEMATNSLPFSMEAEQVMQRKKATWEKKNRQK